MALLAVVVVVAVVALAHTGTSSTGTTVAAGTHHTTTTVPATTVPATTTTTLPALPPSQVKLLILNGTGAGSLAGQAKSRLAAVGYDTLAPDDTTSTVAQSAIYAVSAQYLGAAQALAQQVGLPVSSVATPVPSSAPIKTAEKSLADVVLIIGPGFSITEGGATQAPTTTSASHATTSTTKG